MARQNRSEFPQIPAIRTSDPQQTKFNAAVREALRMMTGTKEDRVLTLRDISGGALTGQTLKGALVDQGAQPPPGSGGPVQRPTQPTGVKANAGMQSVFLQWDLPTYSGHSYTEIYRFDADALALAQPVAKVVYVLFSEFIGSDTTYFYWLRHVNINGVAGPWNASEGTRLQTAIDVDEVLRSLSHQITESQFAQSLLDRIDLIDGDGGLTLQMQALAIQLNLADQRLSQANSDLDAKVQQGQSALALADSQLQSELVAAKGLLQEQLDVQGGAIVEQQQIADDQALLLSGLTHRVGQAENTIISVQQVSSEQASLLSSLESSNETQGASISILQSTTFGHAISISQLGAYDSAAGKYTFIKTLEEADAHQASRIGTLEADNGTTKSRLLSVESVNTEQASRLFVLEADNGTNKNKISTLEFADVAQAQRLNSLESSNETQGASISILQSTTFGHAISISQLGAYDSAAGKYTFIKTLEEADAHQASRIGTLEADNGTTKNRITAVENVNTEQASKLFVLEADNGTNKNKISTLEFADAAQAQRLNSLESSNGTTQSRLMTLEVADANQASRIQQLTLQNHPVPRCALLNEDEWEIEAGLPPSWSYNGTVAEQKIISGTGPYGGPAKLWQATADGDVSGDGGWNKGVMTTADVSKTYRYSVWVKAKPGCTGHFYLGCGYVLNLDNTANGNAYAVSGSMQPRTAYLDKWVLAVGVIHPVGYTGGQSGLSGLYDPVTGQRVEAGTDYKFSPDNSGLGHRAYQFYSAKPGSQMVFTHPRMEVMETAPSLNDLLKSGGQAAVQDAARAYTDTKTGEIRAERTLKVEADGRVAGIGLIAGGTTGSAIYFSADQVAILPPGATTLAGAKLPFIYDAASGGVYMDTTFIRELTASSIRGGLLNLEQGNIRSLSVYNELLAPPQCIDEIHLSPALAAKLAWVNSGSVQTGGSITRTVYANVGQSAIGTVVSGGQAATLKVSGGAPAELSPDYMSGWIDVQILKAGVVVPLNGSNTLRLTISSALMTDETLPRSTWRYVGLVEGGGTFTVPAGTANVSSVWSINVVAVSSAALASRFTVTGSVFETYSTSGSVSSAAEWSQIKNKPTTRTGYGITDVPTLTGAGASGTWGINISGKAAALVTPRAINGTNFDGSAEITTANWGASRSLTIGSAAKSVNGGANVSWSLAEIGAQASLGFTPVRQGGGAGQLSNNLYIGWTGSNLNLQVDVSNFGSTWPISVSGNAATLTDARTFTIGNTGKSFNGSGNVSWSHTELGTTRNFGTVALQAAAGGANITTAQFISWLSGIGALHQPSVMKCSWDYAGNSDISDTGFGTLELAGCVIETFPDGGAYIIRVTSPSTGEGSGGIHEYVNQGPIYNPGWRRVYTSTLNGNIAGNAATVTNGVYTEGNQTIAGVKKFSAPVQITSPDALRMVYGNYGAFFRNDGTHLYLMLTNSGNQYGSWNALRPLTVNLATGHCTVIGGLNGNATTASSIYGFNNPTIAATANTTAYRDGSADISARLFRSNFVDQVTLSGAMAFRVNNSSDDYIRFCSNTAAIRTWMGADNASNLTQGTISDARLPYQMSQKLITKTINTIGAADAHLELQSPDAGGGGDIALRFHQANRWHYSIRANATGFRFTGGGDNTLGNLTANAYFIGDSGSHIHSGGGGAARITTTSGYLDIGAQNTQYMHFLTDRPSFYFGSFVEVNQGISVYNTANGIDEGGHYGNGSRLSAVNALTLGGLWPANYLKTVGWQPRDANTAENMDANFTYAQNAPYAGTLLTMGAPNGYHIQINADYSNTGNMAFRARNGDIGAYGAWRRFAMFQPDGYLHADNWIRSGDGCGLYWPNQTHLFSADIGSVTLRGGGGSAYLRFETDGGSNRGAVYADWMNSIGFLDQTGNWKLRVDSAGMLHVADGTSTSDRRVKRNIEPIKNALAKVKTLTGNTYDQIEMGIRRAGPIAQEIELVLPEAVSADENGKLAVSQMGLIALLIEAVKELSAEVETMKGRLH